MTNPPLVLSHRERAILRAVAAGGAEIVVSCEPDLMVDGRWCDHSAVRTLVAAGLIAPAFRRPLGQRTAAIVTPAGWCVLKGDSVPDRMAADPATSLPALRSVRPAAHHPAFERRPS